MKYSLVILFMSIILFACECPPGAQTKKEIIPTEFAKVSIVNAINSFSAIDLDTKYGYLLKNLKFSEYTSEYIKVGSGTNIIYCKYLDQSFYSIPVRFDRNWYYSAVLIGNESEIKPLLIKDEIATLVSDKSYFRIINGMRLGIPLKFSHNYNSAIQLAYREYTQFQPIAIGNNNIEIFNDAERVFNIAFESKPGKIYTFITYFDPSAPNIQKLSVQNVEYSITQTQ